MKDEKKAVEDYEEMVSYIKKYFINDIDKIILEIIKNNKQSSDRYILMYIDKLLHDLGIASHLKGYQYLNDAVMYLYNRDNSDTKSLYKVLATKYHTTIANIERSIRHAIEISWHRCNLEVADDLFGHSISYHKSKPTNIEFIITISNRVKLDNKR